MKTCPKCSYERKHEDDDFISSEECPQCGVVYEKCAPSFSPPKMKPWQRGDKARHEEDCRNEVGDTVEKEAGAGLPQAETPVNSTTTRRKPFRWVAISIGISLLLMTAGVILLYNHLESPVYKAKQIVDTYLSCLKNGNSNGYEYVSLGAIKDGEIINVIFYKYLHCQKQYQYEDILETDNINYSYACEMKLTGLQPISEQITFTQLPLTIDDVCKTYRSYIDFKMRYYQELYGQGSTRESDGKLITKTGKVYDEVRLVYDLEITNRIGMKLYKKFIFVVRDSILGYRIERFYEM